MRLVARNQSGVALKQIEKNEGTLSLFATSAKGIENCLAEELSALAARYPDAHFKNIQPTRAGAAFQGSLKAGYLACLWLRTASRVLLNLKEFEAWSPESLYDGVQSVDWSAHLNASQTLAVDFGASQSGITHSHFGALKTKDAIVDQFMHKQNVRPNVDTKNPDLRINVYILRDNATLSIDLSGSALHERGYREQMSAAPLKENLAAALLLTAGLPEIFAQGGSMVDPTCGSGTLPIEAARIACDIAPGLDRKKFGFLRWKKHNKQLWTELMDEAMVRADEGIERARTTLKSQFPFLGFDEDSHMIHLAADTVERIGLKGIVHFEKRELSLAVPLVAAPSGLVICNPPYGERLGNEEELKSTYRKIGDLYKQKFKGWRGFVFTGSVVLSKEVGLAADKKHIFFNGAIECRLLEYSLY